MTPARRTTRGSGRGADRGRDAVAALPASIADAGAALRRRRGRTRRRRWRRAAVVSGVLVLVAALVWLVGFSRVLAVSQVEVEGVRVLAPDQVEARAQVPLGRPMVRVDTADLVARVATLPAVESVRVERRWPSTIAILVTERTPVVALHVGADYKWVDSQGTVFHQAQAPADGVIVVEAPEDQRILADLATVAASLTDELRSRVQKITADSPDTITLVLDRDQSVIWGSAAESTTKAQVATAMLAVEATVFDVSAPANPTSR